MQETTTSVYPSANLDPGGNGHSALGAWLEVWHLRPSAQAASPITPLSRMRLIGGKIVRNSQLVPYYSAQDYLERFEQVLKRAAASAGVEGPEASPQALMPQRSEEMAGLLGEMVDGMRAAVPYHGNFTLWRVLKYTREYYEAVFELKAKMDFALAMSQYSELQATSLVRGGAVGASRSLGMVEAAKYQILLSTVRSAVKLQQHYINAGRSMRAVQIDQAKSPRLGKESTERLKEAWAISTYPTIETTHALAQALGLSFEQVQSWFRAQRCKEKRSRSSLGRKATQARLPGHSSSSPDYRDELLDELFGQDGEQRAIHSCAVGPGQKHGNVEPKLIGWQAIAEFCRPLQVSHRVPAYPIADSSKIFKTTVATHQDDDPFWIQW